MTQIVQALHMADYGMERWNSLVGGPSSRFLENESETWLCWVSEVFSMVFDSIACFNMAIYREYGQNRLKQMQNIGKLIYIRYTNRHINYFTYRMRYLESKKRKQKAKTNRETSYVVIPT
jgi:hypothetical protein